MNFYDELLEAKQEHDTLPPVTAPGLLNAVVKEIWDEKHKGMIKVEYLLGEKNHKTSDWVRVMSSYGGKEFGNYWLPEIGTEVIVGFVQGNLNMPIVLGCLWNDTDQHPKETLNENNEIKTIMTKAGNKITFSDVKDKEKITVETPKQLVLTIDDEAELIAMEDKEKKNSVTLDCKNGDITVTAKTSIKLKIGSKEVLSADSDTVKIAAGTIQLDGSQKLQLKGKTTDVSGSTVNVKSNGKLGLEASGVAQLKGSMVKIN